MHGATIKTVWQITYQLIPVAQMLSSIKQAHQPGTDTLCTWHIRHQPVPIFVHLW